MKTWFKFYGQEFLSDPKMISLSATEKALWLTLLCLASSSNEEGVIRYINESKIMFLTGLNALTESWEENEGFLKKFEELGMITVDNEMITITHYQDRQDSTLSPYERVKKYRERKKQETLSKQTKTLSNLNSMITNDNEDDNDRIEKNRIEKNRIERGTSSQNYLKTFPIEDFSDIDATEKQIRLEAEKALNWLEANNKRKSNYKAYLRNWVLKTYKKRIVQQPTVEYEIDPNGLARVKEMKKKFNLN